MERDAGTYEHETEVLKSWWDTREDKIHECSKILGQRYGESFDKYKAFIKVKQQVMCTQNFWPFEDGRDLNDYYWIEITLKITPLMKRMEELEKRVEKLENEVEQCLGMLEELGEMRTLLITSSAQNYLS